MKQLLAVFFILTVLACSSTPPIVQDQAGRRYPMPHYTLQDMRGMGFSTIFYFTLYQGEKDLDGTIQSKPVYLDMLKHNEIPTGARVVMTIEISNPQKLQYALWERVQYVKSGTSSMIPDARGGRIAVSGLDYRMFNYEMPTNPELNSVSYGIDVFGQKNEILFHVGDFNYTVSGSTSIKPVSVKEKDLEKPITHNVKGGLTDAERKKMNSN
jgi:hypothetical protein